MKKSLITMMAAAMMSPAFAGDATTDSFQVSQPSQDFKRLSGAVHVGAATAYTIHGYVPTTEAVQGEGCGMGAIQLSYDFGKEGAWSYVGAVSYRAPMSGHTLYGNPDNLSRSYFASQFTSSPDALAAFGGDQNLLNTATAAWLAGQTNAANGAVEAQYQERGRWVPRTSRTSSSCATA